MVTESRKIWVKMTATKPQQSMITPVLVPMTLKDMGE